MFYFRTNSLGTLLASASDDLQIILWDWASNQAAVAYESEHHNNVFQVNFVFLFYVEKNNKLFKIQCSCSLTEFKLFVYSLGKIYTFLE